MTKGNKNKWWLNGGRGSGRTIRLLCEVYENKIAELENKIDDIKANCDLAIEGRDIKIKELEIENNKLLDVINNQDVKIADLEETIANLKEQVQSQVEATIELDKENANLKTDYEVLSCSVGDFGELQEKLEGEQRKNNGLSDQLTKAKEIIREIMKYDIPTLDYEKAEQFIKDIEK